MRRVAQNLSAHASGSVRCGFESHLCSLLVRPWLLASPLLASVSSLQNGSEGPICLGRLESSASLNVRCGFLTACIFSLLAYVCAHTPLKSNRIGFFYYCFLFFVFLCLFSFERGSAQAGKGPSEKGTEDPLWAPC